MNNQDSSSLVTISPFVIIESYGNPSTTKTENGARAESKLQANWNPGGRGINVSNRQTWARAKRESTIQTNDNLSMNFKGFSHQFHLFRRYNGAIF